MSFVFLDLSREIRSMIYRWSADDEQAFSTFEVPIYLPTTEDELAQHYPPDLSALQKRQHIEDIERAQQMQDEFPLVEDHPLAFQDLTTLLLSILISKQSEQVVLHLSFVVFGDPASPISGPDLFEPNSTNNDDNCFFLNSTRA